jgi:hypothetical protein
VSLRFAFETRALMIKVGYTCVQFVINTPLVPFLLWLLGMTLTYHPPVIPQ